MNSNLWIILGISALAFSAYAIPHGFSLRAEEKKIEKTRKIAKKETKPNQIAIFQQIKNKYVFQSVKNELKPVTPPTIDNKKAKIIFSLPSLEVINSHNISGIIDNGSGDITIVFDKDFSNEKYYIQITGGKEIHYKKIIKSKNSVRILFEEQSLEMVQVVCSEN